MIFINLLICVQFTKNPLMNNKKSIKIITLGCSKNLVDSEVIATQLKAGKFRIMHEKEENPADIVIINTCGFIADAKEESINTILSYTEAKNLGKIKALYVMGCLSERYKKELPKEIPEVDAWFGVNDMKLILQQLNIRFRDDLITQRDISTPDHYAYLKIAEGCNRKCAFCAIPLIRGKFHSISTEIILQEARHLVNKGVKELLLIAQDLSYYGYDLNKKFQLPDLVRSLSQIPDLDWIRLHYAYPVNFPLEILDVMKQRPQVCNYLDIPFQHISDKVLKSMHRGHTRKNSLELIQKIRNKVPDVALRTTLLTGFPGETDKDFQQLLDFVKETRFDRLGVFTYSQEEGTYAARHFTDNIPEDIKQERANEIMKLQQEIAQELNNEKIGKNVKVLIDRQESEYFVGRTQYDSPEVDNEVLIDKNPTIKPGKFYTIYIYSAGPFDLFGTIV